LSLPAGTATELSAIDLESGNAGKGLSGALGDGTGKWRLRLTSSGPIKAMSLLRDPLGYLTNLSTLADQTGYPITAPRVGFAPPATNTSNEGFIRTTNVSGSARNLQVTATDDAGVTASGSMSFALPAFGAQQFTSRDFERGNAGKGMTSTITSGSGNWRMAVASSGDVDVQAFIRTPDGFLTAVHDYAGDYGNSSRHVVFFNPASNPRQVSALRLVNENTVPVDVSMAALDDAGKWAPGGRVMLTIAAGASVELSAIDLESGNPAKGLIGAFGDGEGKWRVKVWSSAPVRAMSLLRDPNGYLTNLSSVSR
jgi:hypothetical protein